MPSACFPEYVLTPICYGNMCCHAGGSVKMISPILSSMIDRRAMPSEAAISVLLMIGERAGRSPAMRLFQYVEIADNATTVDEYRRSLFCHTYYV